MASTLNRLLYAIFFILFSPDTWRLAFGTIAASILTPFLTAGSDYAIGGKIVIGIMILGLGYALFAVPAKHIANGLKKMLVKR